MREGSMQRFRAEKGRLMANLLEGTQNRVELNVQYNASINYESSITAAKQNPTIWIACFLWDQWTLSL